MSSYKKVMGHFPSNNGEDTIAYYIYTPIKKVRAVVQISHGMCECIEAYEELAEWMTAQGILVFGNDHLGHGNTATDDARLGYFAKENGWEHMVADVMTTTEIVRPMFADKPFFIFGHSMGSFVARSYITKYTGDISGAIIMGTNGGEPLIHTAIEAARIASEQKGEFFRSGSLTKLAFDAFNLRFLPVRTKFDWVTRDAEVVDRYEADPKRNFTFTASGYHDLFSLLSSVSQKEWYDAVPKQLPLFIVSGDQDPVGAYGQGIFHLYSELMHAEVVDVTMKMYPSARHELYSELNKEQVFEDILGWISLKI